MYLYIYFNRVSVTAPNPNDPSVLWNSMMHPFIQMTIFGAIWYQGEANAGRYSVHYMLLCSLYKFQH